MMEAEEGKLARRREHPGVRLPWWEKVGAISAALVVGLSLAIITSDWIGYALEGQEVRSCVATGRIGDKPMPEAIAKLIGEQCREDIERNNIILRFERAHSWPVNLAARSLAFLLDPIRFFPAVLFSTAFAVFFLRAIRKPSIAHGGHLAKEREPGGEHWPGSSEPEPVVRLPGAQRMPRGARILSGIAITAIILTVLWMIPPWINGDILIGTIVVIALGWPARHNDGSFAFILAGFCAVGGVVMWADARSLGFAVKVANRELLLSVIFAGLLTLAGGINRALYRARRRREWEADAAGPSGQN
jgi:hypothetical protein